MRATLIHPTKTEEVGVRVLTKLVDTTKHEKKTMVKANLVLKRCTQSPDSTWNIYPILLLAITLIMKLFFCSSMTI